VVSKFYELGIRASHNKFSDTYNCACPICREGKSLGKKKRCFYIPEKDQIYCHNCGQSWSPYSWIKTVSGMTYYEIQEDITKGSFDYVDLNKKEIEKKKSDSSLPEDSINLFDPKQVEFWKNNEFVQTALEYIKARRLDVAGNRPDALYISLKDVVHKNRLVIPFKDQNGKIVHYQSRRLFHWDCSPDYTSKLNSDKSICGLDKIDSTLDCMFLFEGPIDSFFVKNGVGLGGISKGAHTFTDLQNAQLSNFKFFEKIWVLDSQWKDETSRKKTEVLINQGEKVFIWPKKWGEKYKDLNEMCVANKINEVSPKFIKSNTYFGMQAMFKLKCIQ
jgi:hypothetical protein